MNSDLKSLIENWPLHIEEHSDNCITTYDADGIVNYFFGTDDLNDFKADMKKQCIVMMGLPAAGKSTFIEEGYLKKYFTATGGGFRTTNSDNQLKRTQYQMALRHFRFLESVKGAPDKIDEFRESTKYTDNYNKPRIHPVTAEWWKKNSAKGPDNFYKTFAREYYVNYFDLRDVAKVADKDLFETKIRNSSNLIIVDTVAAKPNKIIKRLEQAARKGFSCSVVYLEKPVHFCLAGDKFRYEEPDQEGRGVGVEVIEGYAKLMDRAYKEYLKYGTAKDSVLDRLMYFTWNSTGPKPIDGNWKLVSDKRFSTRRSLGRSE